MNKSASTKVSKEDANIETILSHLKKVYCGKVAYEFMHIPVKYDYLITSKNHARYVLKILILNRAQVKDDGFIILLNLMIKLP